jgi:hypothetical protein
MFLENELPAADGEYWFALEAVPEPSTTCPASAAIPADDWNFIARMWLDFGGQEDACEECVFPIYYCYEGAESPFTSAIFQSGLGDNASVTSYQGWDTTCIGPKLFRMRDWDSADLPTPAFEVHDTNMGYITTTQTVSFRHRVWNLGFDPVSITLDYSSTLDIPWVVYTGTKEIPDQPLDGALTLTEPFPTDYYIWLVADIPAGIEGMETLTITGTDTSPPNLATQTTDLLWIGEWTVPPPSPFGGYEVYLPLILDP